MTIVNELKKRIVKAVHKAAHGHIPSAFSILDIIWVLYDSVLLSDDRFVLSKGHGCLALYAVLEEKGLIPKGSLDTFGQQGSILGGHPDRNKVPNVLCSTGSLGHGLPQAVGMALAKKIKKESGRVFCLVGDGELNEGSCWESFLLIDQYHLDNLVVIVDYNRSNIASVNLYDLEAKLASFGITASSVDGHHREDLISALRWRGYPRALIAQTTKGRSCARMENNPAWHHRAPNDQELEEILTELECENN